jgi:hypothetical protein
VFSLFMPSVNCNQYAGHVMALQTDGSQKSPQIRPPAGPAPDTISRVTGLPWVTINLCASVGKDVPAAQEKCPVVLLWVERLRGGRGSS